MKRPTNQFSISFTLRKRPCSFLSRRNGCVISRPLNRTIGGACTRLVAWASSLIFFVILPSHATSASALPAEIRSDRFSVTVNGVAVPVAHAAAGYHFADFDIASSAEIAVTAPTDGYWNKGIEVQPWRHGIRPRREGRTLRITISQPMKLSISRPGDRYADAEMLFLFANAPETEVPEPGDPGLRYYAPGVYRENIHVKSGETVYLAAGAVVFGSLNVWEAENAKILGRGIVIHDGAQNPNKDEGWQHRPDWHGITMHEARRVVVRGITCVVRSRTWMIQLQGCSDLRLENLKVIGGCRGNANQDGIDWLGCGDTVVRGCFFRCADDIFALYGNTGFYDRTVSVPGKDVRNILVENCVLSTSVSNVVRVGWPRKVFNSDRFTLRNCDVIHMGSGACYVPFALAEFWAEPDGKGSHTNYLFEDVRLDRWYSLAQLRMLHDEAHLCNIVFRNITSADQDALVPSAIRGDAQGVRFENVKLSDRLAVTEADLPLERSELAAAPYVGKGDYPAASFMYPEGLLLPGQMLNFDARATTAGSTGARIVAFAWSFGDGCSAQGPMVEHAFPDLEGTLLDGSGRFRVTLTVTDERGRHDTICRPVLVAAELHPALSVAPPQPGLNYRYWEGHWDTLPDFAKLSPLVSSVASSLKATPRRSAEDYGLEYEGYLRVPTDGGYSFQMLAKDPARVEIAGRQIISSLPPMPQSCRTPGNCVQVANASLALAAGWHRLRIVFTEGKGPAAFALKWQGPGIPLSDIGSDFLAH